MKVKLSGKQYKEFMNDEAYWWHGDLWFEEATISINGLVDDEIDNEWVKNADVIEITDGFVNCDDVEHPMFGKNFVSFVKGWLKKQQNIQLVIELPKELEAELKSWVRNHKCKILN